MSSKQVRFVVPLVLCLAAATHAGARASQGELYPVQVNGKLGFIDRGGRVVIEPRFVAARSMYASHAADSVWFADERAPVFVDGKWGYVDPSGKLRIKPRFSEAHPFADGLASVCVPDERRKGWSKCGIINTDGEFVIKPIYEGRLHFSEGLAAVSFKSADNTFEYGFIDLTGEVVIAPQPHMAWSFSEGLAKLQIIGSGDGFIDRSGSLVATLTDLRTSGYFSEGLIAFAEHKPGSSGVAYIFMDGKFVRDPARKNDRLIGYLDRNFTVRIPPRFDIGRDFHEGLAAVRMGNREGFIDKTGRIVIEPRFEFVGDFSDGLAIFYEDSKTGFINRKGEVVIPPRFAGAREFRGGLAAVSDDVKAACQTCAVTVSEWRTLGYIDKTGEYVWRPSK